MGTTPRRRAARVIGEHADFALQPVLHNVSAFEVRPEVDDTNRSTHR